MRGGMAQVSTAPCSRHVRYLTELQKGSSNSGADALSQASVRRGQFFAEIGFGIGELARNTDVWDNVGAVWLLVKALSAPGERAWQRVIVRLDRIPPRARLGHRIPEQ